jgi:hypothetical protein
MHKQMLLHCDEAVHERPAWPEQVDMEGHGTESRAHSNISRHNLGARDCNRDENRKAGRNDEPMNYGGQNGRVTVEHEGSDYTFVVIPNSTCRFSISLCLRSGS